MIPIKEIDSLKRDRELLVGTLEFRSLTCFRLKIPITNYYYITLRVETLSIEING